MTLLITLHTTFATLWFISVYPYYLFIIDLVLLSASSILQIYVARTAPTSIIMIWLRNTLFESAFLLRLVARLEDRVPRLSPWRIYWTAYFTFASPKTIFALNYLETWRLQHSQYRISVFFDRSDNVLLPCPAFDAPEVDDAWVFKNLSVFYRMSRINDGLLQALLPKSLERIEVVQVRAAHQSPSERLSWAQSDLACMNRAAEHEVKSAPACT
ncbi:hypothetical protein EV126DRAFT_24987 [Verticillium dahliae]|nr:hypothetical protein EV126DRAFT_24987 [Verticillium dahliae]